ncbi:hypothetical protein C9374_007106 [Naegleria lovaniensis]|uniref:Uncharacterized protein n=1 Tax=Naegleria lovaniensis TaxID=51637 RepID=A0AA88GZ32_NAELO|nr:uncharacterized protein C9374_007106 [Naegleria lovaniensis]KAG2393575.1 hypothetical protein C9374_007106 [Naegleria lovaniensis]
MGNKHSQGKRNHGGEYLKRSSSQTPRSMSSNQHSLEKSRHSSLANLKQLLRGNSKENLKQVFKMAETMNNDATIVVTAHPMTTFGDYDSGRDKKVPQQNACSNNHHIPATRSRSSALINAILIKKLEEGKYQQPPIKSPETPHTETARQLMFHDVGLFGFDPRSPTPEVARTPIKKQSAILTGDLEARELNKFMELSAIPFDDDHLMLHSQTAFTPTESNMISSGRSIMEDDGDEHNEYAPASKEDTPKSSKRAPYVTDLSSDDLINTFVLPSPILAFDPNKQRKLQPKDNKEIYDIPILNIDTNIDITVKDQLTEKHQETVVESNDAPSTQSALDLGPTIPTEICILHKEDDFEILPHDLNRMEPTKGQITATATTMKKLPSLKPVPFNTPQPYNGGYMSPSPLHRAAATNSSPFGSHTVGQSSEESVSSNSDASSSTVSSVYATPKTPTSNDNKENSTKEDPIFTNMAVITNNGAKFLPKPTKEVSSRTNHRDHAAATKVATKINQHSSSKKANKSPLGDISNKYNNYIR